MKNIEHTFRYIGADIVPDLISLNTAIHGTETRSFQVLDATVDRLPEADTVLCREVIFHLSFRDISRLIENVRSAGASFLISTTDESIKFNADIPSGDFRNLSLTRAPFLFPPRCFRFRTTLFPGIDHSPRGKFRLCLKCGDVQPHGSMADKPSALILLTRPVTLFTSFDSSTPDGRSKERYRRALLTTLASGLAKSISALTGLISVPLTLRYLGTERYGLWMTMSSLIIFLGFSDLGISNGLMNGISKSHGVQDRRLAQQYVSSAFFFLTAIAGFLGLTFVIAYRWIPWNSIFHVESTQAMSEAGPAAAAFVFCFLVGIPIGTVTRIQSGFQEGFTANLWSIAGNLVALLTVLLVIKQRLSLTFLVLAMAGVPSLAVAANGLVLFGHDRPWLRPEWSQVRRGVSNDLLHSGLLFFCLQLAMAVGYFLQITSFWRT